MKDEKSMVVTAFQAACFGIIFLIAKFVGDWICYAITKNVPIQWLILFILVSALDFFELTNNWVSIKKYFDQYNGLLFTIDVITLGCFFWQIYVLSNFGEKMFGLDEAVTGEVWIEFKRQAVWIIVVSYALIFALYAFWNYFILHPSKDSKQSSLVKAHTSRFEASLRGRRIQVISAIILMVFLVRFGANNIFIIHLIVACGLLCIRYVVKHNHDFGNFKNLIESKTAA